MCRHGCAVRWAQWALEHVQGAQGRPGTCCGAQVSSLLGSPSCSSCWRRSETAEEIPLEFLWQ